MIALRPTLGFAFSHPAHAIAFGFGTGLSPFAPGTAGSALGWAIGWALPAVNAVTSEMGLTGYAPATDLEQAMLDVWSLSEGSNPERLAA